MKKKYKLDKMFGPVGSTAGFLILAAGIPICFFSYTAITLVIIGAFVGLSYTSCSIDFDNKRIQFANVLFGIFSSGKWTAIKPSYHFALRSSRNTYRTYSQSNRSLGLQKNDFRIVLLNKNKKTVLEVAKFKTKEAAVQELEQIAANF